MTPQHSCALRCSTDFTLWRGRGCRRPRTPVRYVAALISLCGGGQGDDAPALLWFMLLH